MSAPAHTHAPTPAASTKGFSLTAKAAAKIVEFAKGRPETTERTGLRVGIKGGGCSGMSYVFEICDAPREKDHVFELDGAKVYIDPKSLLFLDGMTLDWKDSLIHSGFVFDNPHAKKSCGCGTSFST